MSTPKMIQESKNPATLICKKIPGLESPPSDDNDLLQWRPSGGGFGGGLRLGGVGGFACVSMAEKRVEGAVEFAPTTAQLLKHPLAIVALVPKEAPKMIQESKNPATLICKKIPGLESPPSDDNDLLQWRPSGGGFGGGLRLGGVGGFACVSMAEKRVEGAVEFAPTTAQLLKHPLAIVALVPKEASVFAAGAVAGAAAKTVTAPLDRIKLIMQTHGLRAGQEGAKKAIGFIEAFTSIGKQEGIKGYWKGNLAQVIRILPYSAVQLFAYEAYKKFFRGKDGELTIVGRLAAGACAGMTSTFVTYPLDVLRLRLAVDPGYQTMTDVIAKMLKEEGVGAFYRGLGPSLIGIAPYVAVNFCVFDLVKKSLPEKYHNKTETSLLTAFVAATIATVTCYPLDTIRRQMQMRGTPYKSVLDAFPGIIARDGVLGLYRGFVPNALKTLPNSSIRLTTFDALKRLIAASEKELQRISEENRSKEKQSSSSTTI